MTHDILIKGGQVIDGTGSSAKYADVAIKDGIIVEIGKTDGQAEQEIDAEGQTVSRVLGTRCGSRWPGMHRIDLPP